MWLFKAKIQGISTVHAPAFNSANGASSVGQQIGGTGNTVIQNNSADPQLVNTLLDRISARDRELGHHEASLKAKDQLLGEKEAEIQQLRRQGVQSVVAAAERPSPSSAAKDALLALQTGDIDGAQSVLRSLEEQAARLASPHRREAAQLAREQGALWLGRDVEKAYDAFERANRHKPDDLPTLGLLIQISMTSRPLAITWAWANHALALSEKLGAGDPSNSGRQRDLSVSYSRIGNLQNAEGKRAEALKSYLDGLEIHKRLAAVDPANTEWQRDLSISYERIGDLQNAEGKRAEALKSYQDGLEIRKRLAALDKANTQWQRDLSISYDRIGELQNAEGKRAEALKSYQDGLEIVKRLAALDPANTEWQRDLSVSYERIGDQQNAEGKRAEALKSYQDGLEIAKRLAALDQANTEWQTDLIFSAWKLSGLVPHGLTRQESAAQLQEALVILARLKANGALRADQQGWSQMIQQRLDGWK